MDADLHRIRIAQARHEVLDTRGHALFLQRIELQATHAEKYAAYRRLSPGLKKAQKLAGQIERLEARLVRLEVKLYGITKQKQHQSEIIHALYKKGLEPGIGYMQGRGAS